MATGLCLLRRVSLYPRLCIPPLSSSATFRNSQARWQRTTASSVSPFLYTMPGIKAKIIDGREIAKAVKAEIKKEVSQGQYTPRAVDCMVHVLQVFEYRWLLTFVVL